MNSKTPNPTGIDADTFKSLARRLHRQLQARKADPDLTLSILQEDMARALGHKNLHAAQASWKKSTTETDHTPNRERRHSERDAFLIMRDQALTAMAPELVEVFEEAMAFVEDTADLPALAADHPFHAWAKSHRFDLVRMASTQEGDLRSKYNLLARALVAGSPVADTLLAQGDQISWDDIKNLISESTDEFEYFHTKSAEHLDPNLLRTIDRMARAGRGEQAIGLLAIGGALLSVETRASLGEEGLAWLEAHTDTPLKRQWHDQLWRGLGQNLDDPRTQALALKMVGLQGLDTDMLGRQVSDRLMVLAEQGQANAFQTMLNALREHHPTLAQSIPGNSSQQRAWMVRATKNLALFQMISEGATPAMLETAMAHALAKGHEDTTQWIAGQGIRLSKDTVIKDLVEQTRYGGQGERLVSILDSVTPLLAKGVTWQGVLNHMPAPPESTYGYKDYRGNEGSPLATLLRVGGIDTERIMDWAMAQGATLTHERHDLMDLLTRQALIQCARDGDTRMMRWMVEHTNQPEPSGSKHFFELLEDLLRVSEDTYLIEQVAARVGQKHNLLKLAGTPQQADALLRGNPTACVMTMETVGAWLIRQRDDAHRSEDRQVKTIQRNSVAMVEWALDKGVSPNLASEQGVTLLMLCARQGARCLPVAECLLRHGADHTLQCDGHTALDMAEPHVRTVLTQLIAETAAGSARPGTLKARTP